MRGEATGNRQQATGGALDVADLVGVPYEERNCYALVRAAVAPLGAELPEDPAAALAGEAALAYELDPAKAARAGDIVEMTGGEEGGVHLGVCLDAFRVLHAVREGGSRIDQLSLLERTGRVIRRVRLRALIPTVGGSSGG